MLFMSCVYHAFAYVYCVTCGRRLFIAALWSPAGKGLTSWLLFVMFNCVFVFFPCGILGQAVYLILLYNCDEIHLIQPIFLLDNTKPCIRLLTGYFPYHHSPYFTHHIT